MNCKICGRNLNEDSRYCDFCGTKVPDELKTEAESQTLDTKLLLKWLFISIFITAAITLIAKGVGFPILFGGLFLPFFFKRRKNN